MKTLTFAIALLAPAALLSKEIPVTQSIIRRNADAVFVGNVVFVGSYQSDVVLRVSVNELFFDRNDDVAKHVVITVPREFGRGGYQQGGEYVFAVATCGNGAHVLLGRKFSAPVTGGQINTEAWEGFQLRTSMAGIRRMFRRYDPKDRLLSHQVCMAIANCEQSKQGSEY